MNKTLIAILLLTGSLRAQTVGEDGLPVGGRLDVNVTISGAAPDTDKAFVGHYGLAFKYREWLTTRARMEGPIEIIEIFPSRREAPDSRYGGIVLPQPFDPKPEDWRPENFTKLGLVQVIIAPLSLSKYATLEELIKDKTAAMDAQGLKYRTHVQKDDFVNSATLPLGTYTIVTDEPYCLDQNYYRSKSLSFIVSSGCAEHLTTPNVQSAITDFINAEKPRPKPRSLPQILIRDPLAGVAFFTNPGIHRNLRYLLLSFFLLPAHFLGPRFRRFFSAGAYGATAGFTGAAAAWLIARSRLSIGLTGHDPALVVFLVLILQAAAVAAIARRRQGASWVDLLWRVLPAMLLPTLQIILASGQSFTTDPHYKLVRFADLSLLVALYILPLAGLWWGLFSKAPGVPWKRVLPGLLVLCSWATPNASAQGVPIQVETPNAFELANAATEARWLLERSSTTLKSEREIIKTDALNNGLAFDYHRVEVTGMWSDDDTDEFRDGLFDLQLKPSMLNERELLSPTQRLMMRLKSQLLLAPFMAPLPPARFMLDNIHPDLDMQTADALLAAQDATGKLTERAQDVVAALKGKRVNELVAHSWGSQIVYNALLENKIPAPRRLIIVGSPENNELKWELLAKHTGAEVVLLRHHDDPVNRIMGALEPKFVSERKVKRRWSEATASPQKARELNPHGRAGSLHSPPLNTGGGHDRHQYYRDLEGVKIGERNLLTLTAKEMAAAQEKSLTEQAEKAFDLKFKEMQHYVAMERKQQEALNQYRFQEAFRQQFARDNSPSSRPAQVVAKRPIDLLVLGLSQMACSNPAVVTDENAARVVSGADLGVPNGFRRGLGPCELAVMDALLDIVKGRYGAASATKSWIEKIVREHRAANAPRTSPSTGSTMPPPTNNPEPGCFDEYIPELGQTIRVCPG